MNRLIIFTGPARHLFSHEGQPMALAAFTLASEIYFVTLEAL